MPIRALLLRPAVSADIIIAGLALGALGVLVIGGLNETALVEGVFAQEMHGREIERAAARGAAAGLKYGRGARQGSKFLAFGGRFGAVRFDQAAVLEKEIFFFLGVGFKMNYDIFAKEGVSRLTLEISFLSLSMVSLRYFLTMPIVATALVLRVWITCIGAIKLSSSIFFSTRSSSSPASSNILGLEVKYARAAG